MEKPIFLNTEMVKAILDGRKTCTRRLIKPQPKPCNHKEYEGVQWKNEPTKWVNDGNNWYCALCGNGIQMSGHSVFHAPYQVGDVLYVRETFSTYKIKKPINAIPKDFKDIAYYYKADGIANSDGSKIKWRPSIHMPKAAARIFLKVTDVRVERLQDITDEQAKSEGIKGYSKDGILFKYCVSDDWWEKTHYKIKSFKGTYWQDMPKSPIAAFSYLWNSTVKKLDLEKYSWNANPFVWVIGFEVIKNG